MERVAFIGVGNIGNPMAKCLIKANFKLTVYDIRKEAMENLLAMGAKRAESLSECALNEAIIMMVANDEQVEQVISGPAGILQGLFAEAHPIVVVMSTVLPQTIRKMAEKCAEKNLDLIDAPVSGTNIAAEQGNLSIMVGGSQKIFEIMKPVFLAMGKNIYHVGDLGAGEVVKISNNILGITNMFLALEALDIGVHNGVPIEILSSIIETSSGSNFFTRNWGIGKAFYAHYSKDLPITKLLLDLCLKDLEHAQHLAEFSEVSSPLLNKIINAFKEFNAENVRSRWHQLIQNA